MNWYMYRIVLCSHLLDAISFFTWDNASRKNRSMSVRCSRMFFASRFTFAISRVFSASVRSSCERRAVDTPASCAWRCFTDSVSRSNSHSTWPRVCSRVLTLSCSYEHTRARYLPWAAHEHVVLAAGVQSGFGYHCTTHAWLHPNAAILENNNDVLRFLVLPFWRDIL